MSEHEDRLARAGEFVLGLLDGEARDAAERDMATDPAFREAVERFRRGMAELDATAVTDQVPAQMLAEISKRIDGLSQDVAAAPVRTLPANDDRWGWRGAAIAASMLAAIGLGYWAGSMTGVGPEPVVLVVLQTPGNEPGAVFEAFADNSVRIVPLEDFEVPEGKIMQVWTLYDPVVGPVSLGTIPEARITQLGGQPFPTPVSDQLYEITLEPAPGSPTGKPTGPILVKGFARTPAN
jgi:anti-sigma-K factor RskA